MSSRRKDKGAADIRDVARAAGLIPREVENLFEAIVKMIIEHGAVNIPGFGTLRMVETPARSIVNGACGDVSVPSVRWIAFRRDSVLRERMKELANETKQ